MITIHSYDPPSASTWYLVIRGVRNSWESWNKGDSTIEHPYGIYEYEPDFILGEKDKELALKLIRAGSDHGKFMRQLPITLDITGPEYWWKEMDTYRVGVTANSTSMMHTLGKERFSAEMFSWENLSESVQVDTLHTLNDLRLEWIEAGKRKGPEAEAWRAMIQAVPQSWNYRRLWSGNYQVLKNIFSARRAHRLREWRDFCTWIETLPYSELITS